MKTKGWAAFGSLMINLMLGLVIAAVFSVAAPKAHAGETRGCAAHAAAHTSVPAQTAPSAPVHKSHIVAVRMGWAI